MPKVKSALSTLSSHSISKLRRSRKQVAETIDESTWGPSTVPEGAKIPKGQACKKYLLTAAEVGTLPLLEKRRTAAGFVAHLYGERDVELAAWRKYGGPEGFQSKLTERRKKKQGRGKKIEETNASRMGSPAPYLQYDDSRPVIAALRDQLKSKAGECDWLWKRCVDIYRDLYGYGWDDHPESFQVAFLEAAVRMLPNYPARSHPSGALLTTASFQALEEVLAGAPLVEWGYWEKEQPNARHWFDHEYGEENFEWTREYFSQVFRSLIDVVGEHGREGWEYVRWMVYDVYSKSIDSKIYVFESKGEWKAGDAAAFWLHGPFECEYPFFGSPNQPVSFHDFKSLFLPGHPLHR
ncbi:hypothetical protein BKA70DRAFT_1504721 [Coprinopsis sp. MPI-PUGE-AT-0042]|nr:hypothetical protein BKA70DRAFT_1504721 [Coprinopsis sp. MPI-PUGE-AT-0042]